MKDLPGIVIIKKQSPHDPSVKRWSGLFFQPIIGQKYKVPENAGNHPEHRGRTGLCINFKSTSLGMHWATIAFDEHKEPDSTYNYKDVDDIRTSYLISVIEND